MNKNIMFATIILTLSSEILADQPTTLQIEDWFKRSGQIVHVLDTKGVESQQLSIYFDSKYKEFNTIDPSRPVYSFNSDESVEVKLRNSEIAYLLEASGPGGRNDFLRVILLRPKIQAVCEIDNPKIKFVKSVLDLDHNGVSEIVVERVDSGQGSNYGNRYIVQLDECIPIVLRSIIFEDDEGAYGTQSSRYYRKDAKWSFEDIDGDGVLDLKETRIVHEGRNGRPPIITTQLFRYAFKNNTFIRYLDYIHESEKRN